MKIPRPILIFIAILWLFAVTFNYYIVHKPFSVDNALAFFDTLANILVASAIFLLATATGRRVARELEFTSPLEAISLRAGLGLGLLSFATLGLGLLGLLNALLFWVLLFVSVFLLRGDCIAVLRELRAIQIPIVTRFERVLVTFVAVSLVIAFLFALTPPIAWDSQTYHLVEAKHAVGQGRIAPPPDIVYFSFPSLGEMLFLAAMLLKGDIAAQIIHFGYFLLGLGAVVALAERYFNSRIAWLAAAILIAVPSLLVVAASAYVDAMLVFYAFAAFYALMNAFEKKDWRWYALVGAFAGMAMGVKYTGMFIPVAIFVLIFVRSGLGNLRFTIGYLLFAAIFASPWYLRNLFFTGNPVYPFLFGGPYWDAFRAEWFSRFGSGLITTPLKILTAPWDATILGIEGGVDYSATIGPLVLALLPLLLLPIRNSKFETAPPAHSSQSPPGLHRTAFPSALPQGKWGVAQVGAGVQDHQLPITNYLVIFSLILYLSWLFGIVQTKLLIQTRLLYPAFPTLALGAAVALDRLHVLDLAQFSLQRFARWLIALVLGLTLWNYAIAFAANNPLAYLTGAISRGAFLERALGDYYRAVEFINAELPRDAKIVALWEPRTFYLRRAIQPDAILDLFAHRLSQTRDVNLIASGWRAAGYTHVLLYRKGLNQFVTSQYDPVSLDDVRVLQTLLARQARLIYGEPLVIEGNEIIHMESAPYAVYALESK